MIESKLGIGTVQFGLNYGISNRQGQTGESEARSILEYARHSGIQMIDTARAYGNSEDVLGNIGVSDFKVVSKFKANSNSELLRSDLQRSLETLKLDSLYGYMAHNADDLLTDPQLWDTLLNLRSKGLIQKVGYSVYTPEQLESLWELNMIADIVQLPYNLLDRKFEPYFRQLKSHKTEVHIRSVFLQGLFFLEQNQLPVKIHDLAAPLKQVRTIAKNNELTIESLALNYVVHNRHIDFVIVGINERNQLEKNIASIMDRWDSKLSEEVQRIEVSSPALLNPANWNAK